jgi:hypothetical protein
MDENQLRQHICNYLETNPPLMEDMSLSDIVALEDISSSKEEYVRQMRNSSTWGGAIEIKAFCDLFGAIVEVSVKSTHEKIVFVPSATTLPTLIARIEWQGHHFEPIIC